MKLVRIYRHLKGLADIRTSFQDRIDKTIGFKHPAWLNDILIVTKESWKKHELEVKETMKKLEEAGYLLHPKLSKPFKKQAEFVRQKMDQNGMKTI